MLIHDVVGQEERQDAAGCGSGYWYGVPLVVGDDVMSEPVDNATF
jgi:hypothetical protein